MSFDLTPEQIDVLVAGLKQWGGPGRPTNELAVALGWSDVGQLDGGCVALASRIRAKEPMTAKEWTQALASAELAFASDVFGAGYEWQTVTGLDDMDTLRALRSMQRALVSAFGPTVGRTLGTGYPSRTLGESQSRKQG
jgi:hypothetical protein